MSIWTEDKDVWIEQIPHLLSRYGLELILLHFQYLYGLDLWLLVSKYWIVTYILQKGTPLYYFETYSKRSDSDFQPQQRDVPRKWSSN